jgi:ferredoxin-type protein NapH
MSSRSFCKTLCPIAAILGPLNHLSWWAIKPAEAPCVDCAKCDRACPTDGKPSVRIAAGVPANRQEDCIVCHDCQTLCPQKIKETRQKV